eukprot:g2194.t1
MSSNANRRISILSAHLCSGSIPLLQLNPNLKCVGKDTDLMEDLIAGLQGMCDKMDKNTGLGYYETWDGKVNLVVSNPKHVATILSKSVGHSLGGLKPASEAFFGKQVLFVLEGKEWKKLRKIFKVAFDKHNLKVMQDETSKVAKVMRDDILRPYANTGRSLNVLLLMSMYHLSATGMAAFGYDFKCIENFEKGPNDINKSFEFMLTELPRRAYATDPKLVNDYETDNEDNRKFKFAADSVRNEVKKAVQARLDDRARRGKDAMTNDLLESMIRSYEEEYNTSGENLTAQELSDVLGDNLIEVLFAGYNTAVGTTANALYLIASNPEWYPAIQKEIDSVLPNGALPTKESIKELKLLERIFLESLRLVPPAAVLARLTSKTIDLDGIQVPPGTDITFPAFYLHLDERSWGKGCEKFNPDRFLPTERGRNGKLKPFRPKRGSFVPFSDGPRSCVGRHYATMEAVTALAVLLQKYEFDVPADYKWSNIFTGFGLRPFCQNRQEVSVYLTCRDRK